MAKLYRVGSLYGSAYFNTAKEAGRCRPGGEQPESAEILDAAKECNRLIKENYHTECELQKLRLILASFVDMCPLEVIETRDGQLVVKYFEDNPLPPADSADRDGQRSYGV